MFNNAYYPIELHSHTYHSDGDFTPEDLIELASEFGYRGIFITDHNTSSAFYELKNKDLKKFPIKIYQGIEWTTFHGHILILGNEKMHDFTKLNIYNLDACIKNLRAEEKNIAIGIAHPYAIGNPICTGCHFEYKVKDYSIFDYLEICNSENPMDVYYNNLAYERWTKLINKGIKFAALSGRDWHKLSDKKSYVAISMIKADQDLSMTSVIEAIKNSHTYISLGPILKFDFGNADLGDEIKKEAILFKFLLEEGKFSNKDNFSIKNFELLFINNEIVKIREKIFYNEVVTFDFVPEKGTLRFEIRGDLNGVKDKKIVITSPIYVK
ncbi:MAG: CehA/McbA family metallohydrolase [Peptoniphilaceae bacterium]|nr:CehA/McbA family metallohydrolase [Peptoniphilaceae bacterium]MDY6018071.1 CehA/McbA family metallohydrolase [Anaerococcus sp.]